MIIELLFSTFHFLDIKIDSFMNHLFIMILMLNFKIMINYSNLYYLNFV